MVCFDDCIWDYDQTLWDSRTGFLFILETQNETRRRISLLGSDRFLLPMLYASPEYVVHSYKEWFDVLVYKNGLNQFSVNQNISLLGMLHRITGASFSDLWIIVPGMILFALPYLRIRQYQYESFRFLFLSSALLFMVLFSTGTETYGYLTAMVAVGVWYVKTPTKAATPILNLSLLIFCILLTSLSTTDLFQDL